MFRTVSLCFLALIAPSIALSNSLPNREMIILLENRNLEYAEQSLQEGYEYIKPMGIGAITNNMLIALYQKAAPIIANKSLIKNIIDHQTIFNDFINLKWHTLYAKYSHYKKFDTKQSLKSFQANCQYISKTTNEINALLKQKIKSSEIEHVYNIVSQLIIDKRFNVDFAPLLVKESQQKDTVTKDLQLELILYLLCSWIDFDKEWDIKQVNDDIFLLVPKNYIKDLNLNNSKALNKVNKIAAFTNLELNLGLKIDHMIPIGRNFFEQPLALNHTKKKISFRTSLEQIFITHSDLKKHDLLNKVHHIWSLYISGHGNPPCAEIQALPHLHQLKEFYKKKLADPKFKDCLTYEKAKHTCLTNSDNHNDHCTCHKICTEYLNKIEKLNNEINHCEQSVATMDKKNQSTIASLSIDEFRDVLKFFHNRLETALLYYHSCFGGGNHLIQAYLENGKPLLFKYPIITGTPTDNVTFQEYPIINIPPYAKTGISTSYQPSEMHISDIDLENKKLNVDVTLHFNKFFSALRKGLHTNYDNLLLACYALHPHTDEFGVIIPNRIASIPLVRLAWSDHFHPIPGDTSSAIVDTNNHFQSMTINKQVTLLYNDYIGGKITFNSQNEYEQKPQFLSMIPGFCSHVFEEISSSTLNLNEIINAFLSFPELGSSKIFWIKKLECRDTNTKNSTPLFVNNMVIMRNILNSDTLSQCSTNNSIALENCVYFSKSINTKVKLTWDGSFIEKNNYRLNRAHKSEYEEEYLHSFPSLANFLNPILLQI